MPKGLLETQLARKLDPLSLHINSDLAVLFYEAGEREKAMEQLEETLELDPNYAKTHYLIGFVHLEENQLEEAVASFEKSVELAPGTPKYVAALEEARSSLAIR